MSNNKKKNIISRTLKSVGEIMTTFVFSVGIGWFVSFIVSFFAIFIIISCINFTSAIKNDEFKKTIVVNETVLELEGNILKTDQQVYVLDINDLRDKVIKDNVIVTKTYLNNGDVKHRFEFK